MESDNKFPATYIVHTASGPVAACETHKRQLLQLGNFMGWYTHATLAPNGGEGLTCPNCVNEATLKTAKKGNA